MRLWRSIPIFAVAVCGRAEAAAASAELMVSAVVPEQCLVHSASLSANCTGGAIYGVGVTRELVGIATSDLLTGSGEFAHRSGNDPAGTMSHALPRAGVAAEADVSATPIRLVAQNGADQETIRVTYSF